MNNGRSVNNSMEIMIGNLLRAGVFISAATVLAGGILYLAGPGSGAADYRVFMRAAPELCNIRGILHSAIMFQPAGLIQLGLLLLIATPIARVALSVFLFAAKRDRLYTILTFIVLGVLIYSLFGVK